MAKSRSLGPAWRANQQAIEERARAAITGRTIHASTGTTTRVLPPANTAALPQGWRLLETKEDGSRVVEIPTRSIYKRPA